VAGAWPNFLKIAPRMEEMDIFSQISPFLGHTGQQFDPKMFQYFFDDLGIPKPDINLRSWLRIPY
jgi:UDP-N-acetylglucosamine 2-epimerase (non-hydrolysing)